MPKNIFLFFFLVEIAKRTQRMQTKNRQKKNNNILYPIVIDDPNLVQIEP